MTYPEIYSRLNFELAIISFIKKDGTIRIMLGTRNLSTIKLKYGFQGALLNGRDNRCNINNGNIAVYDMEIGDARAFSANRVIDIQWLGVVNDTETYDKLFNRFIDYKRQYEETKPKMLDLDMIDTLNGGGE